MLRRTSLNAEETSLTNDSSQRSKHEKEYHYHHLASKHETEYHRHHLTSKDKRKKDSESTNAQTFLTAPFKNTLQLILRGLNVGLQSVILLFGLLGQPFVPYKWVTQKVKDMTLTALADFFAWGSFVLSLVVLCRHKANAAYISISIFVGLYVTAAWVNSIFNTAASFTAAAPAVAVSIEIFLEVFQANTLYQLVTTAGVLVPALILYFTPKHHGIKVDVQYVLLWAAYRILKAVQLNASASAQWRLSQVCIMAMVTVHLLKRFVPRTASESGKYAIWVFAASGETIVNGALFLTVFMLYDRAGVLPWEIHLALLVVPIAYVAATTLPAKQPYSVKPKTSFVTSALEFMAGCIAIAAATCAFVYDRPADTIETHDDTCDPNLTNLRTCVNAMDAHRFYVTRHCCMQEGYMVVPGNGPVRTALEDICRPTLTKAGAAIDCCGVKRTDDTDALMSGAYACMCNRDPEDRNGNRLMENGVCKCSAQYSGPACETKKAGSVL